MVNNDCGSLTTIKPLTSQLILINYYGLTPGSGFMVVLIVVNLVVILLNMGLHNDAQPPFLV